MRTCGILVNVLAFILASTTAYALVIDDFESGDKSAWETEAPYYAALSIASPGAGGSGNALGIQEITGSAGGHSVNALAHRHFATPANWTGFTTIEFDASISAGDWNGYSILVYNDNKAALLRGIHSYSASSEFRRIKYDISQIQRDKITEIVIYVNRTRQDAGQVLYLDNIQVTNNPVVGPPSEVLIADMETLGNDINNWTNYDADLTPNGKSATYQTTTSIVADGGNNVASLKLTGTSASAYAQYVLPSTFDFSDFVTLQFDVKLAAGSNLNGFSVRGYNQGCVTRNLRSYQGVGAQARKFTPGSNGYVRCEVDISGMTRDQFSSVMFYVNRTGQGKDQTIYIDNIKVTLVPVTPSPDQIWLDTFDPADGFPADIARWDAAYNVTNSLSDTDFVSAPYALNIKLNSSTSTSPYARRSWIVSGLQTYDVCDYRSLIFDAKTVQNDSTPLTTTPMGFSANLVNGVTGTGADGLTSGDYQLPFHPVSYNSDWTTYMLDITGLDLDQLKWLRFYVNRCGTNGGATDTTGQILRLDNIRVSKEPAPPVDYSNVDDFEDGDINDWFYVSQHDGLPGVRCELTNDAAGGNYAVKITNLTPPGSSSAYSRKTMHAKWLNYPTLEFDAKVANSATSSGFSVVLRNLGGLGPAHTFCPTNEWKTFRIDISQDRYGTTPTDVRQEIIGILFYVNGLGMYGASQNGAQELYLDNIRLSRTPVDTVFDTIGDVRSVDDGSGVTLDGKVCTGFFASAMPDRYNWSTTRHLLFIEEADRSAAMPVVLGYDTAPEVPAGARVRVTGTVHTDLGIRYIYASGITVQAYDQPQPDPVGLTNKACGSGARGLDAGVPGFAGQSTNGMLATIWGKVTGVGGPDGSFRSWCYIDDGSAVEGDNGAVGVRVYSYGGAPAGEDDIGKYACAVGFVMNEPERDPNTLVPTGKVVRGLWLKPDVVEAFRFIAQP